MIKKAFLLLLTGGVLEAKGAVDYNRTPLNKSGSITITPQTPAAVIQGYTQPLNQDGRLDKTFNGTGKIITPIGNGEIALANAAVLQPDGKIVAVGYSHNGANNDFTLVRYNSNGSLDTSFGPNGTGIVTTAIGNGFDVANAAVLQSDGKIIAVGSSSNGANNDFALVRYNNNGSLDTTFGPNGTGKVTTPIGAGDDEGYAVALQSDGKIIAVGSSSNGANNDFALVRYNSNGSLDTTFGPNGTGKVTTAIGNGTDGATACVLQPDGKIVVVGYSNNGVNNDFALARYNSNGSLDTSFGPNGTGKIITAIGNGDDEAKAVALQPDGKIVAAGVSFNGVNLDFAVVRYNTNGSRDTTFNGTGIVTTDVGGVGDDTAQAVVLQSDGKIVAAGRSNNGVNLDFAVVRYNTNGSRDTTFGTYGIVTTAIRLGADEAYAVALQPDGKIVAAGWSFDGVNTDFALVRYNTNGSLDTTFGTDGIVTTATTANDDDGALAVVLQPDGKIVAAGFAFNGLNNDFVLVRYINPFTYTSFTASYGSVGLL